MRKKANFIKLVQRLGIIFLMGLGVSIIAIDVIGSYRDFNFRADQMRADYLARQKQIIKDQVDHVIDMIHYEKSQSESLTRNKIKSRVYEAYSIVQNIYQQNQAIESKAKIQQMILDALRPIRFENGIGYYFAVSMDGVEQLYPVRPELEGKNLIGLQDIKDNFVIQNEINVIKKSGEGFVTDFWPKPGKDPAVAYLKISFVKYFKPLDWYFGTGLYVDDVENQIKEDLLSTISRIRFEKEGYIFVNRLNGDALVSNGKLFSGTKKLWEIFDKNPEKMKNIFEKEYNAALTPDGDYIYYSHIKLTDPTKESPKVSFIYGIPDLQWLVGAGIYLDDVESNITLMQAALQNQIKNQIFYYILIIIAIFAVFFLFHNWLNLRLKKDFTLFISFFKRVAHSDEKIDRNNIQFIELDRMAEYANKMLTDRKQVEASLKVSEKKYRGILESIEEGYYEVDLAGNFTFFNNAVCRTLGYSSSEMMGMNNRVFMDSENARKVFQTFNDVFTTGKPSKAFDWVLINKEGSKLYIDTSISLIKAADGKVSGFRGVARNITKRKLAQEEREKLQQQLNEAQKMESVGRLAGGVAHDFNNMLGVIIGHSEMVLNQVDSTQPFHYDLLEIQKAAQRSANLTRQLLAFARRQTVCPVALDLNDSISGMLNMLSRLIGEDIDLVWKPGPDLWTVKMDPVQVDQIMANLLVNARDAIAGVGAITIETGNVVLDETYCESHAGFIPGRFVMMAVSDSGSGMGKDILEHIFEPFYTTKEIGKGTGLGLATVYGIVKQNNGFINVYSELEKGTSFKIYLPEVAETVGDPKKDIPMKQLQGSETVLVVEDEETILNLSESILLQYGYTVLSALTPNEAITLAKNHPEKIHLLITDVVMPEMNGRELKEILVNLYPEIKCLFMSGYTANAIAHHGVLDEGINFIQKPFSVRALTKKVRKILDEAKSPTKE